MKKALIWFILIAVLGGGGAYWLKHRGGGKTETTEAKPADADAGARVSHDEQGNAVIHMADDDQGDAGIVVANPPAGKWNQEVKAYGRVLDPAPLAALVNEMVTAQAALSATTQEWERQKTLSAQSNTSLRALQSAEAAARHDQLAMQSVRDRLLQAWGSTLAGRNDLADFARLLASREAALIRVDLPAGEMMAAPPSGARLVTLSDKTADAKYLSPAPDVDPQIQGQGLIFSVQPNDLSLAPGQAMIAWLQAPGDPLDGVIIPRDSVVRLEGAGWVYLMSKAEGGEGFTRKKIPLDRPTEAGWFVPGGVKPDDYIVTTGAQTLLSEELKAALSPD